jgi:hypothetical protein
MQKNSPLNILDIHEIPLKLRICENGLLNN